MELESVLQLDKISGSIVYTFTQRRGIIFAIFWVDIFLL